MVALAVASLFASGCADESISGNLFARGGVLDDWALDPSVCFSGQPVGFRGVDLCGGNGCIRLKLSQTDGPHLTVYEPHPVVPREFTPDDCDHFRVTFERTPAYVSDVRVSTEPSTTSARTNHQPIQRVIFHHTSQPTAAAAR